MSGDSLKPGDQVYTTSAGKRRVGVVTHVYENGMIVIASTKAPQFAISIQAHKVERVET